MIYAELDRHLLNIILKQRILNFWGRILNGKTSKFSYQTYLYIVNTNEREFKWINYIQSILNETRNQDVWLRQFNSIPFSTGKL